ncbi:docking protein 1 isoform X1 [Hydra vulgaris]|uniref:docking protein 1 isoform X1 n=1 Tax=Hydra vulgaris TaxID=6087 RepID=UPI000640C0A3|nr:docking protein 1 [Hydra vulgaris]
MTSIDNYDDLVKCGYLEVKLPRKHRKFGTQAWKQKWFLLRRKSSRGNVRLEYYRSEDSCLHKHNKKVLDLTWLKTIDELVYSRSHRVCFKLIFKDFFILLAPDKENIREWIRLIKKLVFPQPIITEQLNRPKGSFFVTIIKTDGSERLGLAGDYTLSITQKSIQLYHATPNLSENPVVVWDLDDIPRFRLQKLNQLYDTEKIFTVNLARTSIAKEGEFQFLTLNGREILETVKSHIQQRSALHYDSSQSSPINVKTTRSSFGVFDKRSRSHSFPNRFYRHHCTNTSDLSMFSNGSHLPSFPTSQS